ncbi:MAG: alkaline phosphatase D family protein [Gemmatimonadetes bacterium]|nr:alkaline phosphatase D family protein [Gemmatimonadota bacterium]
MAKPELRVIPGHVDETAARALAIVEADKVDDVRLEARSRDASHRTGGVHRPVATPPDITAELDAESVRLVEVVFDGLRPATAYEVRDRGTRLRPAVEFRTAGGYGPHRPLRICVASCFYRQYKKGGSYFDALRLPPLKGSDLKILMGDNLYLDVKPGMVWERGGPARNTVRDYLRYFREDPYGDALSHSPNVTTWDDHEFWNDYPNPSQPQLRLLRGRHYAREWDAALQAALRAFQITLNPVSSAALGRSFVLERGLPVSVFVADMRSERSFEVPGPRLMPDAAVARLEHWARTLVKPGLLVTGQPLWLSPGRWDRAPASFPEQYRRIWRAVVDSPADILLVSGDVHYSRLIRLTVPVRTGGVLGDRDVYDFVCSPASHIPGGVGSAASYLVGRWLQGGQPRSKPRIPESLAVSWGAIAGSAAAKPRITEHVFSTDAPNALGLLEITPTEGGDVRVAISVLDHDDGARTAASFSAARPPTFEDGTMKLEPSRGDRCETTVPLTLRARRP